jgi:uncharacterized protein
MNNDGMKGHSFRLIIVFIISVILNGCAVSEPTRFYILSPMDKPEKPMPRSCSHAGPKTISITPIELPKYLDRPQIMTRLNENQLHLSEFDQWAEPLKDNIPDVIARNLRSLLCADIAVFPMTMARQSDFRLSISIIRLEGVPGGHAYLEVRWSVSDNQAKEPLFAKESSYAEPVRSCDYKGLVSAYSRLFASLSREIADSFTQVVMRPQDPS